MGTILSIDIGGTNTKYGILDQDLNFLHKGYFETDNGKNVLSKVEELIHINPKADNIAISCPGIIDYKSGHIFRGGAIRDFDNFNIKDYFENRFSIKTFVDNDAVCIGRAELHASKDIRTDVNVVISIGTGVGGTLIIDGDIYRGKNNKAGEFGSMKNLGQDETKTWNSRLSLRSLSEQIPASYHSPVDFLEHFDQNDKPLKDIYYQYYLDLAAFIRNITWVIDPKVIVIGGGITYVSHLIKDLRDFLDGTGNECSTLSIRKSTFKNYAGVFGAATMVKEQCDEMD
ncbi:ROK family protein [Cytobacillus firmus]|uniref:ROK family protein n=1 Tax=Cytobacillus oceanisediminis TaxID=665099 RepID=UPI001D154F7D|nr:ROK family protein [Cytobacillus oceanisediminis]MCC3648532.1 ROK family protein [Cytobacillus oceanisediminis]